MPTVLRFAGLRAVIYPNDHRPAHIHARGAEGEAVFLLNCLQGPAELRESYGFKLPELRRTEDVLNDELAALCTAWSIHHGDF